LEIPRGIEKKTKGGKQEDKKKRERKVLRKRYGTPYSIIFIYCLDRT
jgi:hypothetical protein